MSSLLVFSIYRLETMDEGRERDNTSRRGGPPTLPGLHHSTIQPSQQGFFRVHVFVWRVREPVPEFSNFSGPQASIPIQLVDWFRVCSFVGYSSLHMQAEMIPGKFLHSLKVYKFGLWRTTSVCYVTFSLDPSGVNLCQIVKTVRKT